MKIPTGEFGYRTASIAPQPTGDFRPFDGWRAAGDVAKQVGAIAEQMLDEQKTERKALARARASSALLDREIAYKTAVTDLTESLETGALRFDKAGEAFDAVAQKIGQGPVDMTDFDPAMQEVFQRGVERAKFAARSDILRAGEKAKRIEFRSQVDSILDGLGKKMTFADADVGALVTQADMLDELGAVAYGANWQEKKQSWKDSSWASHAENRAIAARDDLIALVQLEQDVTQSDGFYAEKLDPDKRNAILRGVAAERSRIESKAQLARDRLDARAEKVIEAVDKQISSGIPATAEMWGAWTEQVRGTTSEAALRERARDEARVQEVLRMPIAEQQTFIQSQEAELQSKGGSVRDQANLSRLKGAVESNVKALQETPLLFAQSRTGEEIAPLNLLALVTSNGNSEVATGLRERMSTIAALRRQYGPQVQVRPLLPQEVAALTQAIESIGPREQVALFGQIRKGFDDDSGYSAAMQQVAPDSPVKALAGLLMTKERTVTLQGNWIADDVTSSSEDIALTVLEGEALLNKTKSQRLEDGQAKGFPLPPEKDFRDAFSQHAGRVFADRPQAFETAAQAVRAFYTGRSARDGDVSGEVDISRMRHAVTAVLGEVVDFNGNGEVLAPWGMDKSTFLDRVAQAIDGEVKRGALPESIRAVQGAIGLKNRGGDSYFLTQGRAYLLDASGAPATIDLVKRPNARTSSGSIGR